MKQFHKTIVNIWFKFKYILETNQSNDLTVPTNPLSIYHTAHQRQLQLAR